MQIRVVGIDPNPARRLVRALQDAETALGDASRRVQALLDEAGVSCTVPAVIRGTARTCGTTAADLERRTGLLRQPGPASQLWQWTGRGTGSCQPAPGMLPSPISTSTSSIVVLGPMVLITPPAPRIPRVVSTTVGGQSCGPIVYTNQRRPGVGRPVPPPDTLPAFPDAVKAPRRSPVRGGGGLRRRWVGEDGRIYEWDSRHGAVEVYNKTGKRHLGEYDPDTGKQLKPPDPTRTTEP